MADNALDKRRGVPLSIFIEEEDEKSREKCLVNKTFSYLAVSICVCVLLHVAALAYFSPRFSSELGSEVSSNLVSRFDGAIGIDANGNWEGSKTFSSSSSIYLLKMRSVRLDSATYRKVIKSFRNRMHSYSRRSFANSISWVLLMWSSFSISTIIVNDSAHNISNYCDTSDLNFVVGPTGSSGTIEFRFTGDATTLYDQNYYSTGISNEETGEVCYSPGMFPSYDRATSRVKLSLPVEIDSTLLRNSSQNFKEPCSPVFSLQDDFGVTLSAPINEAVSFDVRSISTALAVNLNLRSLDTLTVHSEIYRETDDGVDFIRLYKDADYIDMDPILCFKYTNSSAMNPKNLVPPSFAYSNSTTCLVTSGWNVFYPITMHAGVPLDPKGGGGVNKNNNGSGGQCWKRTEKWTNTSKCPSYLLQETCDLDIHLGLLFVPWKYQYAHSNDQYTAYSDTSPWRHLSYYVNEHNETVEYYDRFLFESMYMLPLNPVFGKFSMIQEELVASHGEDGDIHLADMSYDLLQTTADLFNELNIYGGRVGGGRSTITAVDGDGDGDGDDDNDNDGFESFLRDEYSSGAAANCPSSYKSEIKQAFTKIGCEGCSLVDFSLQQKYLGGSAWRRKDVLTFANPDMVPISRPSSSSSYDNAAVYFGDVFTAMEETFPPPTSS